MSCLGLGQGGVGWEYPVLVLVRGREEWGKGRAGGTLSWSWSWLGRGRGEMGDGGGIGYSVLVPTRGREGVPCPGPDQGTPPSVVKQTDTCENITVPSYYVRRQE